MSDDDQELSYSEWLATLSEADRDRVTRIVAAIKETCPNYDVEKRVRLDMSQRHAPLAFEIFRSWLVPGAWEADPKRNLRDLLSRETLEWEEEYGPAIQPARDAVGRMLAAGISYRDRERSPTWWRRAQCRTPPLRSRMGDPLTTCLDGC